LRVELGQGFDKDYVGGWHTAKAGRMLWALRWLRGVARALVELCCAWSGVRPRVAVCWRWPQPGFKEVVLDNMRWRSRRKGCSLWEIRHGQEVDGRSRVRDAPVWR